MPDTLQQILEAKSYAWRQKRKDCLETAGSSDLWNLRGKDLLSGLRGVPTSFSYTSDVTSTDLRYVEVPIEQIIQLPKDHLVLRVFLRTLLGSSPSDELVSYLAGRLEEKSNQAIGREAHNTWDQLAEYPHTDMLTMMLTTLNRSTPGQLQRHSVAPKDLWRPALDDSITLLARMPRILGAISLLKSNGGSIKEKYWKGDLGQAYADYLGLTGPDAGHFMSLFLVLHACHEGGPASTNVTRIASSARTTLYQAVTAGLIALSGDIHGGASDPALSQLMAVHSCCGLDREGVRNHFETAIRNGKTIHGFGHAVYEDVDPRFKVILDFALKRFPDHELLHLAT